MDNLSSLLLFAQRRLSLNLIQVVHEVKNIEFFKINPLHLFWNNMRIEHDFNYVIFIDKVWHYNFIIKKNLFWCHWATNFSLCDISHKYAFFTLNVIKSKDMQTRNYIQYLDYKYTSILILYHLDPLLLTSRNGFNLILSELEKKGLVVSKNTVNLVKLFDFS